MQWSPALRAELETRWNARERAVDIRRAMNLTVGQLSGVKRRLTLHNKRGMGQVLSNATKPVTEGRTKFPKMVIQGVTHLRPGHHSAKLGSTITKGRWKGMPIYALTLEERATCPRDCVLWNGCYGNGMPWAKRSPHGADFEIALWRELHALNRKHRKGFAVRLHVLGDFYSLSYVYFWEAALDWFENLRVFGYTARQGGTEIGDAIQRLRSQRWHRFSVRTSGASKGIRTTVIDNPEDAPPGVIVCPAQTGKTKCCGTCGLCWNSTRPIAFLRH